MRADEVSLSQPCKQSVTFHSKTRLLMKLDNQSFTNPANGPLLFGAPQGFRVDGAGHQRGLGSLSGGSCDLNSMLALEMSIWHSTTALILDRHEIEAFGLCNFQRVPASQRTSTF